MNNDILEVPIATDPIWEEINDIVRLENLIKTRAKCFIERMKPLMQEYKTKLDNVTPSVITNIFTNTNRINLVNEAASVHLIKSRVSAGIRDEELARIYLREHGLKPSDVGLGWKLVIQDDKKFKKFREENDLPGTYFSPTGETVTVKVGDGKPFSPTALTREISAALKLTDNEPLDDSTEQNDV